MSEEKNCSMLQWPFYLSVFRLGEKLLQYYNGLVVDLFSDSMLRVEVTDNQQKVESSWQYTLEALSLG